MNDTMKGAKVCTSSSVKLDVIRRLKTVALVCDASESAAHGLLDALNKYEALFAVIGTREGFREVLETIEPLSDAVICAKLAIRKRQGLVVTDTMMEGLRAIVSWQAKSCGAALEGDVYKFLDSKSKQKTELAMIWEAVLLGRMMGYDLTQRPASSPAKRSSKSTMSNSSRSRASSSISSTQSQTSSYNVGHLSGSSKQDLVVYPCVELASPGAEVVVARQPSTTVGLLVARLPGGCAIRRWCSRAIDLCVSVTARFWM